VSKLSILLETMLPNRDWMRRANDPANARFRARYWALRMGLAALLFLIFLFYNIQQHQGLK
jgi:hypothetical protein